MVAAERDFAVREMREMAEQCQTVAEEFQSMADYSEGLVKEINEVDATLTSYPGSNYAGEGKPIFH